MNERQKKARYPRIFRQLEDLFKEKSNSIARMATIIAVLHHKMDYFFWTGFYLLDDGELVVGPYQGNLACINLEKDTGVCWEAINLGETVIIDDVHAFPGHIACDARSNSEIAVPLKDQKGNIFGVFDVDSRDFNSFDEVDRLWLEKIVQFISN